VIGFGFASPYFLTLHNLTNMLLSVSVLGTMAAMSTPVLIARGRARWKKPASKSGGPFWKSSRMCYRQLI
jgi:hypothetical protein